jgi:ATP phosphoribosyltransferase
MSQTNRRIRVALTKGRIEKGALALLENAGYGCSRLREKGRKLIVPRR